MLDCLDRDALLRLDAQDPLGMMRERFDLPDGLIYLDGNSLGALPRATIGRLASVVQGQWGHGLIRSWNDANWIDLPQTVGAKIAPLIGAQPSEVLACDSTSINLHKLAAAAIAQQSPRRVILTDADNFPTDLYVFQSLPGVEVRALPAARIPQAIDDQTALVALTQVNYKTGALLDMAAINAVAHRHGALTLWDLSHSAGALAVDLTADQADLAVGCGYKYLNGGPGAPAYLYVAQRHQVWFRSPLAGWMGHAAPFAFDPTYRPDLGIQNALCGTPSILGLCALDAGIDTFDNVDMNALRVKSQALAQIFLQLVEAKLAPFGFGIACPLNAQLRGSQISLRHVEGYAIMQALIGRGVIGDFRTPDILRFGLTPLYLRYVDIIDAVENLFEVMDKKLYRAPQYQLRRAVT